MKLRCLFLLALTFDNCTEQLQAAEPFRGKPYLQYPTQDAVSVCWFSNSDQSGAVTLELPGGSQQMCNSQPTRADGLIYNPFSEEPGGPHPEPPFRHCVRFQGLQAGTSYRYRVRQGEAEFSDVLRTSPNRDTPVRFMVYSDPENEPESNGTPVDWPVGRGSNRPDGIKKYLVDQTTGYRENLKIMDSRQPDFISIVGDLVEVGGEQRDWDEFWKHNAGEFGSLACRIPILPAIGNHENFAGPGGGYSAEGANFATDKYLTYFTVPDNGAKNPKHKGRYYRLDYGPVTLITLDSSDGLPHKTATDTNHNLEGSNAPDFNPGSEQYEWFEAQLADAQKKSRFTFVQFHHTMFGSGPHSVPFGKDEFSGQSGIPMRVLLPLLMKYGVDLVFSGHDEMLERSFVSGEEQRADGTRAPHSIHFYDVGIGGDGLRGPSEGFDNPYRQFLCHANVPELWENGKLISGGKHYGHLEVDVKPGTDGEWTIVASPVHVFPIIGDDGTVTRWERRVYDDVVEITQRQR